MLKSEKVGIHIDVLDTKKKLSIKINSHTQTTHIYITLNSQAIVRNLMCNKFDKLFDEH